jgi:chloramphenicol O-acetyltransferase type A
MTWFNFSNHKEPLLGITKESVPKLSFGKFIEKRLKLMMPVSISVNHALVDGWHVGQFVKRFQLALNDI